VADECEPDDEVLGEVVTNPPAAPAPPVQVGGVVQTPPAATALPRTGSENQLLTLLAAMLLLGGGSALYLSGRFERR